MNSEPDLLRIEVVDDEMVVSLAKSQCASRKNMIRARR
jgi:hypothetical protein